MAELDFSPLRRDLPEACLGYEAGGGGSVITDLRRQDDRAMTDQRTRGADLSLVVVGRSLTVANGLVPLGTEGNEN